MKPLSVKEQSRRAATRVNLWAPGRVKQIECEERSARAASLIFYWSVIKIVGQEISQRR